MSVWENNLEIVGAELFQRYRKHLMLPGIAMEIRRDYPGLSIVDVLIRVHAGRQIILDGDDFRALRAIRSGRWRQVLQEWETRRLDAGGRRDPVSRFLVTLGGILFTGFCLLSLLASLSGGPIEWLIAATGLAFALMLVWRRNDSSVGSRHAAESERSARQRDADAGRDFRKADCAFR